MKHASSTGFLNSKKRMIMMGPKGGTFVKSATGKTYSPTAKFVQNKSSGAVRKITAANSAPGKAKMAKIVRKVRMNKGVKRGVRSAESKAMKTLGKFNYPDKVFDMVFKGPRKVRKNKGVKRTYKK